MDPSVGQKKELGVRSTYRELLLLTPMQLRMLTASDRGIFWAILVLGRQRQESLWGSLAHSCLGKSTSFRGVIVLVSAVRVHSSWEMIPEVELWPTLHTYLHIH